MANVTLNETAPWSFDWKTDSQAGIALAQKYKSIGDTIDEHYKQAFDPTYSISTGNPSDRRFLRTLAKADEDESTPSYDWAADRDRGMSIGQHFKELGQEIKEHYQGQFGELANVDAAAPLDWSTTWMDFKAKGLAIGKYYQDKGVAISRFYEQQPENINKPLDAVSSQKAGFVPLGALSAASIAGAAPASSDPDAAANAKNDWYVWGMDWQNGKEEAMNLHEEMKSKGQAIANYYRAKFDPTFFANAAELVSNSLDNLSFPSWGENAEADKAHGKEIGEYWASHGKQVGKEPKGLLTTQRVDQVDSGATSAPADFWKEQGVSWKDRGQSIGKYWENFYRSRFDPTYDSKEDMN